MNTTSRMYLSITSEAGNYLREPGLKHHILRIMNPREFNTTSQLWSNMAKHACKVDLHRNINRERQWKEEE